MLFSWLQAQKKCFRWGFSVKNMLLMPSHI